MKKITKVLIGILAAAALIGSIWGGVWLYIINADYDFYKTVPPAEAIAREEFVEAAEKWQGSTEGGENHKAIIDLYNSHTPLAQGYKVQYDDDWCATFVSAIAIEQGVTDIIPTECGCERQIGLFKELGVWQEDDSYKPLPGDIIYYCWSDKNPGEDCTGWANHVGIVVGTNGNFIKVIEGNKDDEVGYRYISVDKGGIRGYGIPEFGKESE